VTGRINNSKWPGLALLAIVLISAVCLRIEGRLWWCSCAGKSLWITDGWSSHTSQHLLDPYSFTHVLHGFALWWVIALWKRLDKRAWQLVVATVAEAIWEVFENTNFVIERYRTANAALGYTGDTVANSVGDIVCCGIGFVIARRFGWRVTVVLFVITEVLLVVSIRNSLLLELLMLLHPIEVVKQWQVGQ
jgi:hypothetical protein